MLDVFLFKKCILFYLKQFKNLICQGLNVSLKGDRAKIFRISFHVYMINLFHLECLLVNLSYKFTCNILHIYIHCTFQCVGIKCLRLNFVCYKYLFVCWCLMFLL